MNLGWRGPICEIALGIGARWLVCGVCIERRDNLPNIDTPYTTP